MKIQSIQKAISRITGKTLALSCLILLSIVAVKAQSPSAIENNATIRDGEWEGNGPTGGAIRVVTVDPSNPRTLYAGTSFRGMYKSTNRGRTWREINAGLPTRSVAVSYLTISSIFVDPGNPRTLYAGGDGVYKSTDGGSNWTVLLDDQVRTLVVIPGNQDILYALAGRTVLRSADGGQTWTRNSIGVEGSTDALAVDPNNANTIYVGITPGGVFKSIDAGVSWRAASVGIPEGISSLITFLVTDPRNPGTVYAGTQRGLFKTTDGAGTWRAIENGFITQLRIARSLAITPDKPSLLYANVDGFVYVSRNGGGNWIARPRVGPTLDTTLFGESGSIAIDPSRRGTIYVCGQSGVFQSEDEGFSWRFVSTGINAADVRAIAVDPLTPNVAYVATAGNFMVASWDGGRNWDTVFGPSFSADSLVIDPTDPRIMYVGSQGGFLFKITTGAAAGIKGELFARNGITSQRIFSLSLARSQPNVLYAATDSGVFRTNDGAGSWTASGLVERRISIVAVDPTDPNVVYAAVRELERDSLQKTLDGGQTWTPIPFDSSTQPLAISGIVVDPRRPDTILLAASSGVFRSTDGGATWTASGERAFLNENGQPVGGVFAVAVDAATGTIYAGTGDGVFRSVDGSAWERYGLSGALIRTLTVDPRSGVLYAGVVGGGVFWRRTQ